MKNKPELFDGSDNRTIRKYKKLAESIAEVNLNVFFQNALDYTEVFNQEPAKVTFDFIKSFWLDKFHKMKKSYHLVLWTVRVITQLLSNPERLLLHYSMIHAEGEK